MNEGIRFAVSAMVNTREMSAFMSDADYAVVNERLISIMCKGWKGLGRTYGDVLSLSISGCEPSKPCTLQRGHEVVIDIDYRLTQTVWAPKWTLFAKYSGGIYDLANIAGFDTDACHDTPCPIVSGVTQHLRFAFKLPEDFLPEANTFDLRTHLQDERRVTNLSKFCTNVSAIPAMLAIIWRNFPDVKARLTIARIRFQRSSPRMKNNIFRSGDWPKFMAYLLGNMPSNSTRFGPRTPCRRQYVNRYSGEKDGRLVYIEYKLRMYQWQCKSLGGSTLTVLFANFDAVGHVNPAVALAETLLTAGHRVVFLLTDRWRGLLDLMHPNLRVIFYDRQNKSIESGLEPANFHGELKLHCGQFSERGPLDKMLAYCTHVAPKLRALALKMDALIEQTIRDVEPDVIVIDYHLALPSIERSGVPWVYVNVCNPLNCLPDARTPPHASGYSALGDQREWKAYREAYIAAISNVWQEFNAYYVSKGCKPLPIGSFCNHSPYLNVYQFPIELDYQDMRPNPPKHYRFDHFMSSGDGKTVFEIPKPLADRPGKLLYFTLGSMGATDVHNMKRLVSILSKSKHRFIVSKGPKHDTYELPDNMFGQKYLPQQQIVPLVDMIITHGGNNTVCEGFAAGKPMIVLPLNLDQYNNAQRVDELGFGVRLDAYKCTSGQLLGAIDRLLNNKQLHERLAIIANRIKRDNSIAKFPQLVEILYFTSSNLLHHY
ncbi:unnamed protein product [Medioppia subpectinata]|uniref:MD-2-related lipid-recognition domain-containing protein n=1 Tax=Medioppia subpectinata TaxID=1979941 RepID=A0A7R9KEJ3_9ACAR|nr:unnamed protein product [Medioppia subpectinata]CAG2101135.1 unnamed protein product [Medioppia subpectinata]